MKTIKTLLLVLVSISLNYACTAQTDNKNEATETISKSDSIELVYFHFSRRCATCTAIENVSKEAITETNNEKISFIDYNLDEEAGKAKGNELGISGQTLIIVAGDTKINLTNEAFLNARTKPEVLKSIIKEKIESLL